MADPLSIIQVAHVAGSVAKKLTQIVKNLVDAPDEVLALSNELWNLQTVLEDWKGLRQSCEAQAVPVCGDRDVPGVLLFQARTKLEELDNLVNQWGKLSQWGDSWNMGRRDRFLWLREKKRVVQLQNALRELRSNIIAAVGIRISAGVTRLQVDVRDLAEQYVRLHDVTTANSRETQSLSNDITESTRNIASIQRTQHESKDILLDMLATMERMSMDRPVDQRFDDYIDLGRPPQYRRSSSGLPNTPLSNKATSEEPPPIPDQSVFSMAVRAKLKGGARSCTSECSCPCHSKTNVQTPQLLQRITGRLFLGYTGLPYLNTQCIAECAQKNVASLNMTYFFPKWFFRSAISLSVTEGFLGTPNLNIKIRRLVPEMSQIFALSRYGDVEGLRTLFMARQASPDDVHVRGGWTALHFAIDHGNVEACKLLLECGADPDWEDATGTSPVEIAWRNILHLRAPPKISETFSVLFPGTEFLQERKFSRLHRIAIELDGGDIEKELESSPESVHAVDIDGWTPLHWAARRGNYHALTQMLSRGADPLRGTENENRNALHLAAQGNSVACLQHLLQYRRGKAVLDIEGRDGYGNTALRISAGYNCAAVTAKLIQLGANLNAPDNFGEPPILSAVYENAHETITLMLNAGADCSIQTKFENTILHFAANESDLETLSLLTRARMRGVNPAAKNSDGSTAMELAAARDRAPPDFTTLFGRLVDSVIEDDDTFDARSTMSYASTAAESWRSVEDSIWFDAEQGAHQDILEKEGESDLMHDSLIFGDSIATTEDAVDVKDFEKEVKQPEDMV